MKTTLIVGCIPIILAACSPTPLPNVTALSQPASLDAPHRHVQYRPAIQDYEHRDATDPQDWRKSNEEQNSGWGTQ